MVLFPNCKINLGLRVTGKRADGYHNLETVFFPLPLRDAAEITISTTRKDSGPFELIISGQHIPGIAADNLCTKAWQLLKKDFPDMPPVKMHLLKAIPIGAGLGGGSADCAFTLILLNDVLKLNISTDKLLDYALQLGSDCPFFILNKPCYATGRGEIMEELSVDLSDYYFVLTYPQIHVSTAETFRALHQQHQAYRQSLKEIVALPVSEWKHCLINEFEAPVFARFPEIARIKQALYDAGADYASMTGTGSSVYGIFHRNKKTGNLKMPDNYRVFNLKQSQ